MQAAKLADPVCSEGAAISQSFGSAFRAHFVTCAWTRDGWVGTHECEDDEDLLACLKSWSPTTTDSQVIPAAAAHAFLIVPIRAANHNFVTVGRVAGIETRIALSLANELGRVLSRSANANCPVQVSQDFEELTALRKMVKCLRLSTSQKRDLAASVRAVLPLLLPSLKCDAVALVTATHGACNADGDPLVPKVVQVGKAHLSELDILAICDHYSAQTATSPIVDNSPDAYDLKNLVVVEIANDGNTWGWLLAMQHPGAERPYQAEHLRRFGTREVNILRSAASVLATHANNTDLLEVKEQLLVSVVRALVATLEAKDLYTCGHSERVALYAKRIAIELGLNSQECEQLYMTGLLHDIGKIAVPDATLNKKGELTEEEMEQIRQHPEAGCNILRDLGPLKYVLPGVLYHHERYDGKGYPHQLAGTDIPLAGRILAVADAYDAMTSDRSYRDGLSQPEAETILQSGMGTQWDADVVTAAFTAMEDLVRIRETYYARQVGILDDQQVPC